jgi:hypothetical protein
MQTNIVTVSGVSYSRENGKWLFNATKPNSQPYTLIVSGRASEAKAAQIAKSIGASVKRGFVGDVLDPMAAGQVRKLTAIPAYLGIDFSFAK